MNRVTGLGVIVSLLLVLVAILAPVLAPSDPRQQNLTARFKPPSQDHLFGTDYYGRDVASRVIMGSRTSLVIGIGSVLVALIVGGSIGMLAGYYGGWVDNWVMRLVDAFMAFPTILLGLMVVVVLGGSTLNLILAIGLTLMPQFARLARGPTLSAKAKEYVEGARSLGAGDAKIIFRHILPNIVAPLAVMATLYTAQAIRLEAGLSFLGLGVPPPAPTWGNMVREGVAWIGEAPWLSIFSGAAILLTVLGFNLLGDGIRDWLDPQSRREL